MFPTGEVLLVHTPAGTMVSHGTPALQFLWYAGTTVSLCAGNTTGGIKVCRHYSIGTPVALEVVHRPQSLQLTLHGPGIHNTPSDWRLQSLRWQAGAACVTFA